MMLTWLDLLALLTLALGLALGYQLGLGGALLGLGMLLYLSLAGLGLGGAWWALLLGLLLGLFWKSVPLTLPWLWEKTLGVLGGGMMGLFLALAIWAGFPAERVPGTQTLRYPSLRLPPPLYQAITESPFAREAFAWAWRTPWARKALGLEGQDLD